MADTKISALTDGATADATDRLPAARSPFGASDNRYITPAYLATYLRGLANTWGAQQTFDYGTLTASTPTRFLQTWNNAAVAFTALLVNPTDTASAAGALLLDLQLGGSSKASIGKDGTVTIASGAKYVCAGTMTFNAVSGDRAVIGSAGCQLAGGLYFGWSSTSSPGGTNDLALYRDAPNTLAQRNGTNAQTLRVYNTYTDGSNYERGVFDWSTTANKLTIGTANAGTGSARNVVFARAGTTFMEFGSSIVITPGGISGWAFNASGHLLANADNTYDIGASGATRPRAIYVAGTGTFGGTVTTTDSYAVGSSQYVRWTSRARISSPADSVLLLGDAAATDFGRLQFGGTTSSFPALKRSSAELQVRLADDSAYGAFAAAAASLNGHLTFGTDNTYDIGASGATRPRNIYTAGNVTSGGFLSSGGSVSVATGSYLVFGSRGGITAPSDGVFTLVDQPATSFGRLQFGGTTSSFPALKRSSAALQARLADDSDFAEIQGKHKTHANAVAETPTPTHTIVLYDAAGTAYRVPCVV